MSTPSPAPSTPSIHPTRKPRIPFSPSSTPLEILSTNPLLPASSFQIEKHRREASRNWDIFYKNNKDGFFKERHWTEKTFEVLGGLEDHLRRGGEEGGNGDGEREEGEREQGSKDVKGKGKVVLEVGCGTGAFAYPLIERFPTVRFHAFDFSTRAVDLVKTHPLYTPNRINTFVHDLTSSSSPSLQTKLLSAPPDFWSYSTPHTSPSITPTPNVDIISCIFVLSALPPRSHLSSIRSLLSVLTPNGSLILRDYALHDQAQLRFHALPSKGYATVPSLLSAPLDPSSSGGEGEGREEKGKPWYRRGDSTMTYFFSPTEVDRLIEEACELELGGKWRMEGKGTEVVERVMENRSEGWGCTRRFVQGSWKLIEVRE